MGQHLRKVETPIYPFHITVKAKVLARCDSDEQLTVSISDHAPRQALKAVSCLVRPEPGDTVLLECIGDECWITAVLSRESCPTVLELSPGVSLAATDGNLAISTNRDCRIHTGNALSLQSDSLHSKSKNCCISSQNMSLDSTSFTGLLQQSQLIFGRAEIIGTKLMQRLGDSIRTISGTEHVEAGTIMQRVKNSFSCFSARTFLKSKKEVRVDADEIHMG